MASEATPNGKAMSRQTNGGVWEKAERSKWSPVSDAIVRVPAVAGEEGVRMMIDKYMDSVLYGTHKSPLPVFDKLCRENN